VWEERVVDRTWGFLAAGRWTVRTTSTRLARQRGWPALGRAGEHRRERQQDAGTIMLCIVTIY
jgi:hypothetical protein